MKSAPSNDYDKMCSLDNLRRAYRWIQSNPDPKYKSFFRDSYSVYAASSENNLKRLRRNLVSSKYEPGHASKLYLPKPSGILRPYTLLTVNDQIVYQACVNIIAEKLKSETKNRYKKVIFAHLYAGKRSKFFYLKWQNGYKAFTKNIIQNIQNGYKFVANFDLAAFYDSIDHNVLRHFLTEITTDDELITFLLRCLKKWSSQTWSNTSEAIYHGHGIPQGPLASGMISEVVSKYLDKKGHRRGSIKYLRYVDDIKIFAKSEAPLRQRLITLDLASKDIGLFPQSSKINIREVSDPLDEIKSLSMPYDPLIFRRPIDDQEKLRKRLLKMSRGGKIEDKNLTRFKYLLGQANPSHQLNQRLVSILSKHPILSPYISRYFSKYNKLPKNAAKGILTFLKKEEIYHQVHADLLLATIDNMQDPEKSRCVTYCYDRLFTPGKKPPSQPSFKSALIALLLQNNKLTYSELDSVIKHEKDWWIVKDILKFITLNHYGKPSYKKLLNELIRRNEADVARTAAQKIVKDDVDVSNPTSNIHISARLLLHAVGKIRRIGKLPSMVGTVLSYVLEINLQKFKWDKLLGSRHKDAEGIALTVKSNYESDINSCIVTLDSLCDSVFEALFQLYQPGKKYGNYGAMLKNTTMKVKLPTTCDSFLELHELRLQSHTSHPRHRRSGLILPRFRGH